jgi:hypothetical protein
MSMPAQLLLDAIRARAAERRELLPSHRADGA